MSKQRQKPTISNRLRRGLAGILSLALLIGLLPAAVIPAEAADHWATPYVNTLVDWGVMRGDISGNMAPGRTITRAEFVAMMNRAYGYTRTDGHPFTDVRVRDWYNDDIDIGYNMGYFKGTSPTTASPNSPLTREQAAVLLARNMMLQPTVGETLGFSDTRTLSDWSRGLVGAAAENGILGGYSDGSFKPQANITRGEVAAMLVRAIGTPIQTEGDHTLGNVYGNVTVNTPGVKLRDGVITGNLYLTGGIDLGDVLMENITVLGEIVVSGAGESNSSQSSIVLRNVTANAMTVDSISDQFVTIRAEGNTDIKETTVRTSAYVDDSSLPGYGLWKIIQDGGSLLQLAGNTKEVINKTPNSELQVVQGVADKVTIDEKATGSSVFVDGDARVDELDLDVATDVTGEGDIKNLNVGAAGSTVEQLPDTITIRPGITADVNGSEMNSSQAAEASSEPRLLAGYPRAKSVAPTSATLVFSVNKPGTIYWAVSAVSDGSVSEADLIENPAYGGKILQAGTITAEKANTEYTANVANLAMDGSYYISAILVDGRDKRSPVKVSAFSTPDGSVPAFIGNPTATLRSTRTAQVTGMPNKSCQLFWALLPEGAAAPTPAEFKANAVRGNLGYGSIDVTKNVSQSVNVNRGRLTEKTNYVAYLWLTDHDGAQSSQVYAVPIYIPDETPPELGTMRQTGSNATSVETSFTMNETGTLYWAIVTDQVHEDQTFIGYDITKDCPTGVIGDPGPSTEATSAYLNFESEDSALAAKIAVTAGTSAGAIVGGSTPVTSANTLTKVLMTAATGLDPAVYNTSTFYMYYVGEDSENPGNLSKIVGVKEVNVMDEINPEFVEQRFDRYNANDLTHPLADTNITLVFSEPIQSGASRDRANRFLVLYQAVQDAIAAIPEGEDPEQSQAVQEAREALSTALHKSIKLYAGTSTQPVPSNEDRYGGSPGDYVLDYRYARVERENGTGRMLITFPHSTGYTRTVTNSDGTTSTEPIYGASLKSGTVYHFRLTDVYDCAAPRPNDLKYNDSGYYKVPEFRTAVAQVDLKVLTPSPSIMRDSEAAADPATATENDLIPFKADVGTTNYGLVGDITEPIGSAIPASWANNPPQRIDRAFLVDALDSNSTDPGADDDMCYDILIWADTAMKISLYSRPAKNATADTPAWNWVGTTEYSGTNANGMVYRSLFRDIMGKWEYDKLSDMEDMEYAIHVDELYYNNAMNRDFFTWKKTVQVQVNVVAGSTLLLQQFYGGTQNRDKYNSVLRQGASSIGVPDPLEDQMAMEFSDRKAPNITGVSLTNSDRYPDIRVELQGGGKVNYLFIPLTNLQYEVNGNNVRLPDTVAIRDTMITNGPTSDSPDSYYITSYFANPSVQLKEGVTPKISEIKSIRDFGSLGTVENVAADGTVTFRKEVLLALPTRYTVIDGNNIEGVIRGETDAVADREWAKIDLEKNNTPLKPNTIYFLCLVPQGDSYDTISNNVFGWRFTTQTETRPVITLSPGTSDRTTVNVNATVNTNAGVWSILVDQTQLNKTPMAGNMSKQNVEPEMWDQFKAFMESKNISTVDGDDTTYKYSILQAMLDSYNDGSSPQPSVFDVFASTGSAGLKESIRRYIENGSDPGVIMDFSASQSLLGNQRTALSFNRRTPLDGEATYICFAMARTDLIDNTLEHGFRAYRPVELLVNEAPKIKSITLGSMYYTPAGGIMGIGDTGAGPITIQFDKTLYVISLDGNRMMMVADPDNDKIDDEYCGLKRWALPGEVKLAENTAKTPQNQIGFYYQSDAIGSGWGPDDPAPSQFTIPLSFLYAKTGPSISGQIVIRHKDGGGTNDFVVYVQNDLKASGFQVIGAEEG